MTNFLKMTKSYVFNYQKDRIRTLEIFGKDVEKGDRFIIVGGGNID